MGCSASGNTLRSRAVRRRRTGPRARETVTRKDSNLVPASCMVSCAWSPHPDRPSGSSGRTSPHAGAVDGRETPDAPGRSTAISSAWRVDRSVGFGLQRLDNRRGGRSRGTRGSRGWRRTPRPPRRMSAAGTFAHADSPPALVSTRSVRHSRRPRSCRRGGGRHSAPTDAHRASGSSSLSERSATENISPVSPCSSRGVRSGWAYKRADRLARSARALGSSNGMTNRGRRHWKSELIRAIPGQRVDHRTASHRFPVVAYSCPCRRDARRWTAKSRIRLSTCPGEDTIYICPCREIAYLLKGKFERSRLPTARADPTVERTIDNSLDASHEFARHRRIERHLHHRHSRKDTTMFGLPQLFDQLFSGLNMEFLNFGSSITWNQHAHSRKRPEHLAAAIRVGEAARRSNSSTREWLWGPWAPNHSRRRRA